MKKLLLLTMAIAFLAIGCQDDDESTVLRYDGDNSSAPLLDEDVYQAAVRFPTSLTSPYEGLKLTEVEFYILDEPGSCEIIIYGEGNSTSPGTRLYSSGLLSVDNSSWNTHVLPSPLTLTGDDLWISVEFSHGGTSRTVGCDPGPAVTNGDFIFSTITGQWQTLRAFTIANAGADAEVSINWNVRGILEE